MRAVHGRLQIGSGRGLTGGARREEVAEGQGDRLHQGDLLGECLEGAGPRDLTPDARGERGFVDVGELHDVVGGMADPTFEAAQLRDARIARVEPEPGRRRSGDRGSVADSGLAAHEAEREEHDSDQQPDTRAPKRRTTTSQRFAPPPMAQCCNPCVRHRSEGAHPAPSGRLRRSRRDRRTPMKVGHDGRDPVLELVRDAGVCVRAGEVEYVRNRPMILRNTITLIAMLPETAASRKATERGHVQPSKGSQSRERARSRRTCVTYRQIDYHAQ